MTAIRWMSGVLAAMRRRGPTRQLRGRVRFLEQARDGMRDTIRSIVRRVPRRRQCEPMEALAKEIYQHIGEGTSYELQDPSRSTLEESGAEPAAAWLPSERRNQWRRPRRPG